KPVRPAEEREVLVAGQLVVEAELLRHVADQPPHVASPVERVAAQHRDAPARGAQEAAEHADERGLPGAVRAEEPEDRALPDADVDAVHRGEVPEPLAHSAGLEGEGAGLGAHGNRTSAQIPSLSMATSPSIRTFTANTCVARSATVCTLRGVY